MHQRLRHYEIIREIGRGSMGVVYEARDSRLGRRVAIKILPPDQVADSGRRLRLADDHRVEKQVTLVDEIGFERMPRKVGAANDDVVPRFPLELSNGLVWLTANASCCN